MCLLERLPCNRIKSPRRRVSVSIVGGKRIGPGGAESCSQRRRLAAVTALLVGLVLWAFGLHLAWLFALLVFALTFIPSVGPIIATLLPLPVAVTQFQDPWMILAVVAVPGAIHMTIGNLITPKLMGRGLELHPVTVLLALAFWGLLWGIVGMVLAVPMVAMLRIVLSHFSTTRSLANLLAGHLPGTEASKSAAAEET